MSWLFVHVEKNDLIRKVKLISKFTTSQPGIERVTLHILLNISSIKGNQKMRFGQIIEYIKRNIFLQIHLEIKAGELVPDLILFFEKALYFM